MLNDCIENCTDIATGIGLLAPIPKPGKPKGPTKNLRPVTLLPIVRKILSCIVHNRIKPNLKEYLSPAQSAYREGRSTSDIVWAYRWMAAKTQTVKETILVTGIDLSSAFDTIDRYKLINLLENVIEPDELQMIKVLLNKTSLSIKMKGVTATPFETNVGSPQGDGLSGDLFTVYFEHALRTLRTRLNELSPLTVYQMPHQHPPSEVEYADDADFITVEKQRDEVFNQIFSDILQEFNLKSNVTKTEHTVIERGTFETELWRHVKKLGSLLGDREDINRRKQLAIVAMNRYEKTWIRNTPLNQSVRLDTYNIVVKPVLLYNCSTWGLTVGDEDKLDAFHRKQLRRVLGKRYPDKISNKNLYETVKSKPISIEIAKQRWQLFGHILRLDIDVPAYQSMLYYFQYLPKESFRGGKRTTIVTTLNRDLELVKKTFQLICFEKFPFLRRLSETLISRYDLEALRTFAQDRTAWRSLVGHIYSATEASKSFI